MNRLLLVDGDPRSLNVLGGSLTQAGYEVTTAVDGLDALAKVESVAPQLVIAAARLRKLDGFDFVRHLRDRAPLADVPVILIGNDESADERGRAHELGAHDYITRPIFVRELVARVHLLFARRERECLADLQRLGTGSLSGSTRNVAVVDLVQSMDAAGEDGVLHLISGVHKARLYFREGHVVDADLGTLRGEEAVYRAFLWYDADFELELRPVTNPDVIVCSTQTIVRKGMQQIDAWLRSPDRDVALSAPSEDSASSPPSVELSVASVDLVSIPPSQVERELHAALVSAPTPIDSPPPEVPKPSPTAARSSSAPWTREIEPRSDGESSDHDDVEAAGVPRRTGRTRRIVAMTIAMAAVVLLAAGVRSAQRWQPWRAVAHITNKKAPSETLTAAAAVRAPRVQESTAATADTRSGSAAGAPNQVALDRASAPTGRSGNDPAVARPEAPIVREGAPAVAKELPIDAMKLAAASLSPLVREAQKALLKGQTERALGLAKQAVDERPTDADAWLTLAAAQKASGDFVAARDTYLNCVQRAQTATLNHCRVLASKPPAPSAHPVSELDVYGTSSPAAPPPQVPAPELAQSHALRSIPPPGSGNRPPEGAAASPKASDAPAQAPPPSSF